MNSAAKSVTESTPANAPATERETDMDRLVSLLSERAGCLHHIAAIQIEAEQLVQMFARTKQREYSLLTEGVAESEKEIEELMRSHPEWLENRKSIPTPFGTPKLTSATSLEAADEARSIDLIFAAYGKRGNNFIRLVPTLNLPALGELSDEELLALAIQRKREEKFSIADAKINLGKAVKSVATKEGGK